MTQLSKFYPGNSKEVLLAHFNLAVLIAVAWFLLASLTESPYLSIIILDCLLCVYLASLFKGPYKYAFLLHPVILFCSSQLFTGSFLYGGDGEAYGSVVSSYFNSRTLSFDIEGLFQSFSLFDFLKYVSLGVVPIFAVPEFFFNAPPENVYYLWQGTFHVFLCVIVISLARAWQVVEAKYIFAMALFLVISPTFFELGGAPTRHYVTLFGVSMLIMAHIAMLDRITLSRVVWFAISITMILLSKAVLMAPYLVFIVVDLFFIRKKQLNFNRLFLLGLLGIGLMLMTGFLAENISGYEEISMGGAATFSSFVQIPVLGWVIKYIYALLAPFPWTSASIFIEDIYRGNWLLFFMHILSTLSGLYLFLIVIINYRKILRDDIQTKQLVLFAIIMSLSILRGQSGFHAYISIYFPMLAPLLTKSRLAVSPLLPILFVGLAEAFVVLAK